MTMECSITDGPKSDDEQIIPDVEFIRAIPTQCSHVFPLTTRIQGLLNVIAETDHVPAYDVVEILKESMAALKLADGFAATMTAKTVEMNNVIDELAESLDVRI